eukprot:748900-Hanusia_phi.AAC.1
MKRRKTVMLQMLMQYTIDCRVLSRKPLCLSLSLVLLVLSPRLLVPPLSSSSPSASPPSHLCGAEILSERFLDGGLDNSFVAFAIDDENDSGND